MQISENCPLEYVTYLILIQITCTYMYTYSPTHKKAINIKLAKIWYFTFQEQFYFLHQRRFKIITQSNERSMFSDNIFFPCSFLNIPNKKMFSSPQPWRWTMSCKRFPKQFDKNPLKNLIITVIKTQVTKISGYQIFN